MGPGAERTSIRIDRAEQVDEADLLRMLAAHGLPGASPFPVDPAPAVGSSLVNAARNGRLTGPLLDAVRSGAVELADEAVERLVDAHREALVWCLRLEQRLIELDDLYRCHDVPFVVVKGPAVAHLDLADPGDRTWADVDVLVPPEHIDRAVAVLVGSGVMRITAEPRPGWDRRFAKSVELRGADHIEIDVHRTLAHGVFGARIPLDHLHQTTERFELGGRSLRALSPPARVLHVAYHAIVGSSSPPWPNLRDLARYATVGGIPLTDVVTEARRWRGEAVLASALRRVRHDVGVDAPEWYAWADTVAITPRDQVLADRLRHGDAGLARARLDLLAELGSYRERAAYLRGLALPLDAEVPALERYRRWLPHVIRRR